jgi:hypothetical protein
MTSAEEVLGFYDEDYLYFAQHTLGQDRTQNEVLFIWQALSLSSGISYLTLAADMGGSPMLSRNEAQESRA